MPTDDTAPATKQDINLLMEMIGGFQGEMHEFKKEVREEFKETREETDRRFDDVDRRFDEVIRYIDVKNEQLMHDAVGVAKDMNAGVSSRVDHHEKRITNVEQSLGMAA